nr:PspC domain-containing protein [Sphingomonas telluris]
MSVNNRFVLNRSEGKVMGVAAGLADWMSLDVLLVRLGLVAALLISGPVVLLFYVLTGWLAADR